jgi:hypothetical protein
MKIPASLPDAWRLIRPATFPLLELAPMHDPRLPQLLELWFMNFGSQGVKVKTLLQKSPPPLLELFLRYAPDPADRHKISSLHMGRWLARITRGPPIAGWMLRSWTASGQLMFSCTEVSLGDGLTRAAGARPPGAALIKIAPGTHPQDALKAALDQGRNAVLEAMCSGDAVRVQDAQAFLKEIEVAAKQYLDSWAIHTRVEKAWNRHA